MVPPNLTTAVCPTTKRYQRRARLSLLRAQPALWQLVVGPARGAVTDEVCASTAGERLEHFGEQGYQLLL